MPGREDKRKEPWDRDRSSNQPFTTISNNGRNGTGKQRMPKRPPNLPRVDTPPHTPRVARPIRETSARVNWRRRLVIWSIISVACIVLACGIGYATVNFFAATSATLGPATVAANFISNLSSQDYDQAYNALDATITIQMSPEDFKQQAKADDSCYGTITNYSEVEGSATVDNNGKTQSYTFNITRSKLAQPYKLRLTLQQDNDGNWKISSYGNNNDLGPGQPPCD